jgi:hypothetical protein
MIRYKRIKWSGHIARMKKRIVYRSLVGESEGKRPLGGPRYGWKGSNKMDLRETGIGGMNWTDLPQDTDQLSVPANTAMNLPVP